MTSHVSMHGFEGYAHRHRKYLTIMNLKFIFLEGWVLFVNMYSFDSEIHRIRFVLKWTSGQASVLNRD